MVVGVVWVVWVSVGGGVVEVWGFGVRVVSVRVWVSGCGLVAYVGCGRT